MLLNQQGSGRRRAATLATATALWAAFVPAPVARAQESREFTAPASLVARLVNSVWTTDDGLPQNSITDILQTRDGYLWFATYGGLARFNGTTFQTYTMGTEPGLLSNRFLSLAEDRTGALWIGHERGGVSRKDGARFESFIPGDGLPEGSVWDIVADAAGAVWIATGQGLGRFEDGAFTTFGLADGLPSPAVRALLVDGEGTLWVGTRRGLARRHGQGFATVDELAGRRILGLTRDSHGAIWVSTDGRGLLRFDSEGSVWHLRPSAAEGGAWGPVAVDADGVIWLGGAWGVRALDSVRRPDGDAASERTTGTYVAPMPGLVSSIAVDREGNVWIGSDGAGLFQVRRRAFSQEKPRPPGSPDAPAAVFNVLADGEGGIWFTVGCSLRRFRDGVSTPPSIREGGGVRQRCPRALARDVAGGLLYGDGARLVRLHDGALTELVDLGDGRIHAIHEDADGTIWLGSTRGLASYRGGALIWYDFLPGIANRTTVLAETRDGALWIGTETGLRRLVDGRMTTFTAADGLGPGPVRALYEDANGVLWIGTYGGGLTRFARGEFVRITKNDGLPDDAISWILEDDQGRLWINSNAALFYVSRDAVNEVADGTRRWVEPVAYGSLDGWFEGNGGSMPAGTKTRDGALWFATIDGFVHVDPVEFLRSPEPPQVVIEAVLLDRNAMGLEGPLEIPPGRHDLEIRYAGLSFTRPDAVRFQYRLVGFDDEWMDVSDRRVAFYTHLPPGDYRFEVVAANGRSGWSEASAGLPITVRAFFWQTTVFRFSFGIAVALLLVGTHWTRTRAVDRRAAKLRREMTHRAAILNAAHDCIFEVDDAGRIRDFNPAAERTFVYSRDDMLGRSMIDLIVAERDRKAHDWGIGRPATGASDVLGRRRELTAVRSDGTEFPGELTVVRVEEEQAPFYIGFFRDLSETRQLEERYRHAQKMEAVGRLAAGVAHDFNNLLTPILGYSQLTMDRLGPRHPSHEALEQIGQAAEHGAALVRRLLSFSRPQPSVEAVVDVGAVIEEIALLLRSLLGADVTLTLNLSSESTWVRIDPGQLEQVLVNFAVNAADAMPEGGQFTVTTSIETVSGRTDIAPGRYVRITVTDTGVGMDAETRSKVFEPFFTTKATKGGTGLGLATVFTIVDNQAGRVLVDSAPGEGSTFQIYLPASHAATQSEIRDDAHIPDGGGAVVLLVDDDAQNREVLTKILAGSGYEVISACDGPTALELAAETGQIDVLLSDVVMPGMRGTEVVDYLRPSQSNLRVVLMSGFPEAMALGDWNGPRQNVGFVQKPISRHRLAQVLKVAS